MPKMHGRGFGDIEMLNRFKEPTFYDNVDKLIDWSKIERILKRYYKKNKNAVGNPAYPALRMFKILLVQRWENYSDPQMEFALRDKLSVIKFTGFSLSDETPDHSTICRFRRSLPRECMEELLSEINSQLEEKGFIVRGRKERVVDATLVRSACRSRKYIEGEIVEDRKEEEVESSGGNSVVKGEERETKEEVHYSKDKEASWVKKGKRYHYGHKVMLSVDVKGFFHNAIIETAKVSDMKLLIPLLSKMELCEETLIIGDKGFSSKENREYIEEKGCVDLLMHKKPRGKKLPNCLKTLNKAISKVRYVVEQSIGILKLHLGLERFRYIGQEENLKEVFIAGMALNAKKAVRLMV